MTHNDNQDIERMLTQYGEDRRRQQEAAERLRGMARHQRRTWGAALAAMLAVAILAVPATRMLHRSGTPQPQHPLTAAAPTMPPQDPQAPQAPARQHAKPPKAQAPGQRPTAVPRPQGKATPPPAAPLPTIPAEGHSPEPPATDGRPAILPTASPRPLPTAALAQGLEATNAPAEQPSRLRLTAQVGATMSTNYYERTSLNAGVGLSVALAAAPRYGMGVGVGVEGYLHAGSQFYADAGTSHHSSIDQNGYTSSDNITEQGERVFWDYPAFALYATLPLTVDLYPSGRGRAGLTLSLTPGRAVTPVTRQVGMVTLHGINPWKLTLGVGMALPRGWLRSVGVTANLLPSYVEGPLDNMHEVGLTIGF